MTTLIGTQADDTAEKFEKGETLKKNSDELKANALETGKQNSLRPGTAYAIAPGWSRDAINDLDELLVRYTLDSRLHGHDNNLPDPYEKK
ncbi:hypothetical protein [Streptomyces sp. NPDC056549]|uniref:hypothetical protein n=1 Tax=Streptomyces sp. NPDC056549 TaxID=3345864 RepID=UPI0036738DA8